MRKKVKKIIKFILNNDKNKKEDNDKKKKKAIIISKIKKKYFFNLEKKSKFIGIVFLIVLFFYVFIPKSFFFIAAILLTALSRLFQRFCPFDIGIELVILFTACISIAYGALIGAIFGFFSMLTTMIVSNEIRERWCFIPLISILSIALIAASFQYEKYMSFALFGLLLALEYDCLFDFIFRLIFGRMDIFKRIIFYVTHLYFNYFLFFYFGEKILALIM